MSRFIWMLLFYSILTTPIFGTKTLSLIFDGKSLTTYQNDHIVLKVPAVAGRPFFQSHSFQYVKNKGPLPEGTYRVDLNNTRFFNQSSAFSKLKWMVKYIAWGNLAIPLIPDSSTYLKGRHSFMIHGGGWFVGSKGCIVVYEKDWELYHLLMDNTEAVKLIVTY